MSWSEKAKALKSALSQALKKADIPHTDQDYGNDVGPSVGVEVSGEDVWRAMVVGVGAGHDRGALETTEAGDPIELAIAVHIRGFRGGDEGSLSFTADTVDEAVSFLLSDEAADAIGACAGWAIASSFVTADVVVDDDDDDDVDARAVLLSINLDSADLHAEVAAAQAKVRR